MIHISTAILAIEPNAIFTTEDNFLSSWDCDLKRPTEEEIQSKLKELQAAEPMRLLRLERNLLLQQTDWRMTTDYPYADQDQWASYRTQLRNLPASSEPTLDESGKLIVDWPTPPDQT